MVRASSRAPDDDGRAVLQVGLVAILLFSPLPFGSVQPWAVLTLEVGAALVFSAALAARARADSAGAVGPRGFRIAAAAVLGVGVLQLVPVPPPIVSILAPPTAEMRASVARVLPEVLPSWLPLSLSPPDSLDALLRLAAYVALAFVAAVAFVGRREHRRLMIAVVAAGAFQALYGAAEYLTGHQHIFGYAKRYYLESATGTFINRNHYAGYLALCLPMALGLAMGVVDRDRRAAGTARQRIVAFIQRGGTLRLFGFLAAALMWIGVFTSYSRAGLAAALLATVLAGFGLARPRFLIVVLLVCLLPALYLSWQEVKAPGERFVDDPEQLASLSGRLPAWRSASGLVPDQPLLGYGFGTFESAFRVGQPSDLTGRWDHAHNDWLQSFVEGGVVTGLLLIAVAGVAAAAGGRRVLTAPRDRPVVACLVAGLAATAFHALFDFSLRIPAVAALFAVQAGILAGHLSRAAVKDEIAAYRDRRPRARAATETDV